MGLVSDEGPVEELAPAPADPAFDDRVHARRLDGGAQDSGAGGLVADDEGAGDVRSAVAAEEF
jgi:hypothetical protein